MLEILKLTPLSSVWRGYAVLVGSCFRSTPQILRIIKADSAAGVSLFASIAELVAYSITCAYNMRLGAVTHSNHSPLVKTAPVCVTLFANITCACNMLGAAPLC